MAEKTDGIALNLARRAVIYIWLEDVLPERNHLMRAFLLLFLLFPVLELYVFFKVSTAIGFSPRCC